MRALGLEVKNDFQARSADSSSTRPAAIVAELCGRPDSALRINSQRTALRPGGLSADRGGSGYGYAQADGEAMQVEAMEIRLAPGGVPGGVVTGSICHSVEASPHPQVVLVAYGSNSIRAGQEGNAPLMAYGSKPGATGEG